ncbi:MULTISPECIES: hypothetical protein [Paenibacillus]|uniref:Uncharacterized protein n=1 Tax=Paenibacillus campinasensis TaxID=66347 RepID=A0A268F372_9BACL|nr:MULTISPECIES: hypothetical protein [Paenibacillus]MUG64846.1 hypothetical protein [Paenibacillus campinasensis]PAD79825.1 hypothetical protein CHH67_02305 [Paenibacillus campinasensis]PAK53438.1 hypothetical protein CHH75_09265 [Paenibacillus sp. 7541]
MTRLSKTPPPPSEEDAALVRDYVTYSVLLACANRDLRTLRTLDLKLSSLYIHSLDEVKKDITEHRRRIQLQLRRHGIRLYREERCAYGIEAHYLCRGFTCSLVAEWAEMKPIWIHLMMNHIMNQVSPGTQTDC